jgi:hypothetical protein
VAFRIATALVLAAPNLVAGQALADPLVPAGRLRLDFAPSFSTWDARFGLRDDGSSVVEALGADLTDPLGVSLFPGVQTLRESLASVTGLDGYQPRLGSTHGRITQDLTRIDAGFRLGVFDWLTVGATAPIVKGRTAIDFAFRPDTLSPDLGLSPAISGAGTVSAFLSGLETASLAADAHATSVCGGGGGDCDAAQALAARATDFWGRMASAYFASPFFPMATSPVAGALQTALDLLNSDLLAAGLSPVGVPLVYSTEGLAPEDLATLSADPAAGIHGSTLQTLEGLWTLGDVELTADVRLVHGEIRDPEADTPKLSYSVVGGALVRLGTGTVDDPDVFFDVGSGDGQTDVEGHVLGALQVGRRLGLRAGLRYGVQNARTLVRRVARHEMALPPASATRWVEWTPGAYSLIDLSPRVHVTDEVSFAVDYLRWHKGEDTYEMVSVEGEGVTPLDAAVLGIESEMTLQQLGFGLRYSTLGSWRAGEASHPVEAGVRVLHSIAGSGGRTPRVTRVEFSVSLFRRLWGRP